MESKDTSNSLENGTRLAPVVDPLASNSAPARFSIAPGSPPALVSEPETPEATWEDRRWEVWPFLEPDASVRRR
jgi:hypothetical protein